MTRHLASRQHPLISHLLVNRLHLLQTPLRSASQPSASPRKPLLALPHSVNQHNPPLANPQHQQLQHSTNSNNHPHHSEPSNELHHSRRNNNHNRNKQRNNRNKPQPYQPPNPKFPQPPNSTICSPQPAAQVPSQAPSKTLNPRTAPTGRKQGICRRRLLSRGRRGSFQVTWCRKLRRRGSGWGGSGEGLEGLNDGEGGLGSLS